jgi:hypothetical protein
MLVDSQKPSADVIFAVRMLMIRYGITPAEMMKILVAIDKGD